MDLVYYSSFCLITVLPSSLLAASAAVAAEVVFHFYFDLASESTSSSLPLAPLASWSADLVLLASNEKIDIKPSMLQGMSWMMDS